MFVDALALAGHIASEHRAIDERLNLFKTLETLGASDLTGGALTHSADTAAYLDALRVLRATNEGAATAFERPALGHLAQRVVEPLNHLARGMPNLRRLIDARKDCCSDYDAYQRRLRAEQQAQAARVAAGSGDAAAADDTVAKAEAKVAAAAAALQEASAAVSHALGAAERTRAALACEAAQAVLASRVHMHACCSDTLQPLLLHFPGTASSLTELAGFGRVVTPAASVPPSDATASASRRPVDGKG